MTLSEWLPRHLSPSTGLGPEWPAQPRGLWLVPGYLAAGGRGDQETRPALPLLSALFRGVELSPNGAAALGFVLPSVVRESPASSSHPACLIRSAASSGSSVERAGSPIAATAAWNLALATGSVQSEGHADC